jgi:hypothetical protein
MSSRKLIVSALVLAAALAGAAAQARGSDDVQWSVSIGTSAGVPIGPPVYGQYRQPRPVLVPPAPVAVVPVHSHARHAYRQPTRWDHDGDGIPNRRDRVYNPRWDVDGDGIPNRHDRSFDPQHDRDGVPHRFDRDDGMRHDRDGMPNGRDRGDDRGGRWGR